MLKYGGEAAKISIALGDRDPTAFAKADYSITS